MRWSDWYWAAWVVILFGVPETIALATGHPENTLSETAWRWFDVVPGKTVGEWTIAHFVLFALLLWLFGHLAFGWWAKL